MKFNLAVQLLGTSAILTLLVTSWSPARGGSRDSSGKSIYAANCESCHMAGKNVIKPEKEIITSAKLGSESIFKDFLKEKHGYMPAFPEIASQEKDLHALYKYVRTLKGQSWEFEPSEPEVNPDVEKPASPDETKPPTK